MELNNLIVIDVKTHDKLKDNLKVTVKIENHFISAASIHERACKQLGLKYSSRDLFSLFEGFEKPERRIKPAEQILPINGLSLQKWCFNRTKEVPVMETDDQATHLIYMQAVSDVIGGKLSPSVGEQQKLDEYSDPEFLLENQYVLLCQNLEHYYSVIASPCGLGEEWKHHDQCFTKDAKLTVIASKYGLTMHEGNIYKASTISWYLVKCWSCTPDGSSITYTIATHNVSQSLHLITSQAQYLLAGTMELLRELQMDDDDDRHFHASMIHSSPDGSTVWDNVLYDLDKAQKFKDSG